jgi:hypothetical protein
MLSTVLVVGGGAVTAASASASTATIPAAVAAAPAPATAAAAPQAAVTIWEAQGYYTSKAACVDVGEWYVAVRLAHAYACKKVGHPVGPLLNPWQLWLLVDWGCGGGAATSAEQRLC